MSYIDNKYDFDIISREDAKRAISEYRADVVKVLGEENEIIHVIDRCQNLIDNLSPVIREQTFSEWIDDWNEKERKMRLEG